MGAVVTIATGGNIVPSFAAGDTVIIQAVVTVVATGLPATPTSVSCNIWDPFNNQVVTAGALVPNGPAGTYIYQYQTSPTATLGSYMYDVRTVNTDTTQNVSLKLSFLLAQ